MRAGFVLCIVSIVLFAAQVDSIQAGSGKEPVIIGATASMEGMYKEPSMMIQRAFGLWAEDVNQRGGLLGRKVELKVYDDKSDPGRAGELYAKLVEQDKADLLLSPYSTPLTLAASEVSERHEMLMLSVAAGAEKPWKRGFRYLFQLYAPANRQFIGLLDMMAARGLVTLSVLYDETSEYNLETVYGIRDWAEIYGMEIVLERAYRNGKRDFPGLLREVRAAEADGLILAAYPRDSYELLGILEEMRYRPQVLALSLAPSHPDFMKRTGDMADNVFSPSQWEPDERIHFPGTVDFVMKFYSFTGVEPTFHAASAYAACQLLEQAVVQTQSLDNRKLRDYIAALDTVTVLGRFKVDHTGLQIGHNSFMIQWQSGKKEIVWPRKMQTAQPVFK